MFLLVFGLLKLVYVWIRRLLLTVFQYFNKGIFKILDILYLALSYALIAIW